MKYQCLIFCLSCLSGTLHADVATDGSLGAWVDLPGPVYRIRAELGKQEGGNLFHSFSRFSLRNGEAAVFSGSPLITNVIGRVSGGEVSRIDGIIANTIPNANTYLINPAGMIFGPQARLSVSGSFHAASAHEVRFAGGQHFSVNDLAGGRFSSASPTAFGFLGEGGAMRLEKAFLSVPPRQQLTFAGKELAMDDSLLSTVQGDIRLAAVNSQGEAGLDEDAVTKGEPGVIQINNSFIDAGGQGGGRVVIRSGHFMLQQSIIAADGVGAENGRGMTIQAEEAIINGSVLSSISRGSGGGGDIAVHAGHIEISGFSQLTESPSRLATDSTKSGPQAGPAGNISLQGKSLTIKDGAFVSSSTVSSAAGGNIAVKVENIQLSGASSINVNSGNAQITEAGAGGNILIQTKSLHLREGASIRANTATSSRGGNIHISSASMQLQSGAFVSTLSSGGGNAGDIEMAVDDMMLHGHNRSNRSGIFSQTLATLKNAGKGGNIAVRTQTLALENGAFINADSFGGGQGGNININAQHSIRLSGESSRIEDDVALAGSSVISASARGEFAHGTGGHINIDSPLLTLSGGAQIGTSTYGPANAGSIMVKAAELHLSGENSQANPSSILSRSTAESAGPDTFPRFGAGGDLRITTDKLYLGQKALLNVATDSNGAGGRLFLQSGHITLEDGARLFAGSGGLGRGGQINIHNTGIVKLSHSRIETQTGGADGGDINLSSGGYVCLDNSLISASVFDQNGVEAGDGGNLSIRAPFMVFQNTASRIIAQAVKGRGGNISITAKGIYPDYNLDTTVSASSAFGRDGTVVFNTPDSNALAGVFLNPGGFLHQRTLLTQHCTLRRSSRRNRFLIRRTGKNFF